MKIKCIAIGNRIMGDDSIGIKVLENLSQELEKEKIEVIFGETDIDYALNKIDDGDLLFIIDSTYFNIEPGTVTFTSIEKAIMMSHRQIYSQHQPNLINLLKTYKKSVTGHIVGIEVEQIHFSLDLSETLRKNFFSICEEIHKFINQTIRGGFSMHDTFLLSKISHSLKEICNENKMNRIEQFTLVVNHDSHINEGNLLEHLKFHNSDIISNELKIEIERKDIEKQTAIIKSIQGEAFGA